jgi:Acyl-CoA reductase (LuxC)
MNLQQRINLLFQLGNYFIANAEEWRNIKEKAERENGWFSQSFIDLAVNNIVSAFLDTKKLNAFIEGYSIPDLQTAPKTVGLVMAGNIPLVGFHDWLCVFLSGHHSLIKPSSKDQVLIKHIVTKMKEWDHETAGQSGFAEMLKGCDGYIATGSNNSARYFEYYFNKYPHIIRRNRTSVAILTGNETAAELDKLADDVQQYYGLGCRNVTKIWVPRDYNFIPLLEALKKYDAFAGHNKYKNNYDYQLALALLNNVFYMTNGSVLLIENESVFSPISQLNYSFYSDNGPAILTNLQNNGDIQCVIGKGFVPFGKAHSPALNDFADGVDTMKFLLNL